MDLMRTPMNNDIFERLLNEEEGTTLDFKEQQYLFVKASDEEKSELLKDILGFCNAWRRSDAYILIGVKEIRGGRSEVLGIQPSDQLDDHSLQQFVNSLTNFPVRFRYEAFQFEGKQVGIFQIEEQDRPVYLVKKYGNLEKDRVYVRRGSSTNSRKWASPDEIAKMGARPESEAATISIEFGNEHRDQPVGPRIVLNTELCNVDFESIPQYSDGADDNWVMAPSLEYTNQNYYSSIALYEFQRRLLRQACLIVANTGKTVAKRVRVVADVPKQNLFIGALSHIEAPRRMLSRISMPATGGFRSRLGPLPGETEVTTIGERHRIEMECGDLQPGRSVASDFFLVGKGESGEYSLEGLAYADNLPTPQHFVLTVETHVKVVDLDSEEIMRIGDDFEED
jgi:hypothetical protein